MMRRLSMPRHWGSAASTSLLGARPSWNACAPSASVASTPNALTAALRYLSQRADVRNIAVIAHVDHGKTTLVDSMLKQSGTLSNARNRVMDSKDQEKERGITILAKNTAVVVDGDKRINIVDTPGHLDFSGEVERALQMVEGFILLVDAQESVKPGTRYVLRKALALNLKPIIVLNKIDKDDANLSKTESDIQDLFLEVAENDDQLDLFFMYGSGRDGYIAPEPKKEGTLKPLFDNIFSRIPAPSNETDNDPFQMLVAQLDVDDKTGQRIAIGRIFQGTVNLDDVLAVRLEDKKVNAMVKKIDVYTGTLKESVKTAKFGDIVALRLQAPIEQELPLEIGATICDKEKGEARAYKAPDAPTFSLVLSENKSSWAGKENTKKSHFAALKDRVLRECMTNTALKVDFEEGAKIKLRGRGPLHLSVLLEDMRREGLEFEVAAPSVEIKTIDGEKCEPFEKLSLEVKDTIVNDVSYMLTMRHADLGDIEHLSNSRAIVHATIPVRLMMGLPVEFHSLTKGDGVMNHSFFAYQPMAAVESERENGTLVAMEDGVVTDNGLKGLQDQGHFFATPGTKIFKGQVIGENTRQKFQDLPCNPCKEPKAQGGFRANAVDAAAKTRANYKARNITFEDAMGWVTPEESIVVTPESVRIRLPAFSGKTRVRNKKK